MRTTLFVFSLVSLMYAQTAPFDLLITNAKVIDGTGAPWFYSDIGIRGDSIAAIGVMPNAAATVKIDARGLTVAPGFIDVHSHGDRGIFTTPTAENYMREGVTTFIGGPDGSSAVPVPRSRCQDSDLHQLRIHGGTGKHPRRRARTGES